MKMKIQKLDPGAKLPIRGSTGASGLDVGSLDRAEIKPGETVLLRTGLAFEIPPGYFLGVYPRSSLVKKKNLGMPHSVGIIDSDYRGELWVSLRNLDRQHSVVVEQGERIAQIILQPYEEVVFEVVENLSETERGEGSLGSTGKF